MGAAQCGEDFLQSQKLLPLFASLWKLGRMHLLQHPSFALGLLIPPILHLRVESSTISMRFSYAGKWQMVWNYLVKGKTSQCYGQH